MRRMGADGEPEIAVIHRPRYDDWSLPKGKLEQDEDFEEAAIREVEEETGHRVAIGRELGETLYRDRHGRPKIVRYWLMTPLGGRFLPDREVDELEWMSYGDAHERLSYDRDREILSALDGAGPDGAAVAPPADTRRNPPPQELYPRQWKIFPVTMIGLINAP